MYQHQYMLTCSSAIKFIVHFEEPSFNMEVFSYQFSKTFVKLKQKERDSMKAKYND